MGHRLIKHLESAGYNRKLFYIDAGEEDLPEVTDKTSIQPGSEARSLLTGSKWVLNTNYQWIMVVDGAMINDVPKDPVGIQYVRESTINGGAWVPAQFTAEVAVGDFTPNTEYEKYQLVMYNGLLFRSRGKFTSGMTFNPADWEPIEAQVVTKIIDFVPFYEYVANEAIKYDNTLYRARTAFTSGAAFNINDWEVVVESIGLQQLIIGAQITSTSATIFAHKDSNVSSLKAYTIDKDLKVAATGSWISAPDYYYVTFPLNATVGSILVTQQTTIAIGTPMSALDASQMVLLYTIPNTEASIAQYTTAEWQALADKPDMAVITDSIFDI